ncbi:hypothetical protein GCM10027048_39040 [Hymenobacter coalescens]
MTGCTKPTPGAQRRWWGLWAVLVGLLVGLAPTGATAQEAATAAVPDSVRTALSARHQRVPGSTFYVRPAAGFVPEESLYGLAKPSGALLEVTRVPGVNFLKISSMIVQQYLAERGARVAEQRELTFNGYPAVFGRGESLEPGKDLMLLAFGDSAGVELVFGLYQDDDAAAEAELRQMLLTGWYDARGTVPPLELAPFVISLTGTPFQLLEVRPAEKLYLFGPKTAAASADSFATRFSVQVLPPAAPDDARLRLLRLARAWTTPGATLQSRERQLTGSPYTYEVEGSGTLRGRRNAFYQVVRTDEEATLLFHGVSFDAAPKPTAPKPAGQRTTSRPGGPPDPTAGFRRAAATLRMKR